MPGASPRIRRQSVPPGWRRCDQAFVCEVPFREFDAALRSWSGWRQQPRAIFAAPDMCILDFNRVRLTTANPKRVTLAELRLVEKVESVLER